MAFTNILPIPTAEDILRSQPIPMALSRRKAERDRLIRRTLAGGRRLPVIIGPCSAHDTDAVLDSTERPARIQEEIADRLELVPRIYTNKPRTTGDGHKGTVHQPHHRRTPHMVEGIAAIRSLHLRTLRETGLSAADEMPYPDNYVYPAGALSSVAIGAPSVENQPHRMTVSGLDVPVGRRIRPAAIFPSCSTPFRRRGSRTRSVTTAGRGSTTGNPLAHAILRGGADRSGFNIPNYHSEDPVRTARCTGNATAAIRRSSWIPTTPTPAGVTANSFASHWYW